MASDNDSLLAGSLTGLHHCDVADAPIDATERDAYVENLLTVDREVRDHLDGLARLASSLCDAPIAVVSLVGRDALTFLGQTGLDGQDTPQASPFCTQAILGAATLVVPDATLDPRFCDSPLVTGQPHVRFYAGHPLRNKDGMALGSLCVADRHPRAGLTPDQLAHLATMAHAATLALENWAQARAHGEHSARAQHDIDVMTRRFVTLADALPQLVWSTPPDGMSDYFSSQWLSHTGADAIASYGAGWIDFLHPDDVEPTKAAWRHSVETGGPYQVEYRLRRHDGEYIWMLARGLPVLDAHGGVLRWIGTCTDINDRMVTSEALEMMSRELSHRIKNLFSVVQSLVTMGLRQYPELADVSRALQSRMVALGRAHDLVRPRVLNGQPAPSQTMLCDLADHLIAPFQPEGAPRVVITGDDVAMGDSAATPMALFLHEMLTNSVRFGALNAAGGGVVLNIAQDGDAVVLDWRESDGPAIMGEPKPGFGTRLIQMTIERQLGGAITRQWSTGGLIMQARIPLSILTAD